MVINQSLPHRYKALAERIRNIGLVMDHNFRLIHQFNVDVLVIETQAAFCAISAMRHAFYSFLKVSAAFVLSIVPTTAFVFVIAISLAGAKATAAAVSAATVAAVALLWKVPIALASIAAILYLCMQLINGIRILKNDYKSWIPPHPRYGKLAKENRRFSHIMQDLFMGMRHAATSKDNKSKHW